MLTSKKSVFKRKISLKHFVDKSEPFFNSCTPLEIRKPNILLHIIFCYFK